MIMWTYNTLLCRIEVFHNKMQLNIVVKLFIHVLLRANLNIYYANGSVRYFMST